MGERVPKCEIPRKNGSQASQSENRLYPTPKMRQALSSIGINEHGADHLKSLLIRKIPIVTLVFSRVEAWPRCCSDGITGIIAQEELCL
jgi:hypothetical protein